MDDGLRKSIGSAGILPAIRQSRKPTFPPLCARTIGVAGPVCIPLSALTGANVLARGGRMPWYEGPTLLDQQEGPPWRVEEFHWNRFAL